MTCTARTLLILSALLASCGPENTGTPVDPTARDVEFGSASITYYDRTGVCPPTGMLLGLSASGGISARENSIEYTGSSADVFNDNTINPPSGLGKFRVALGEPVCASVASSNWESGTEVCHTIEPDTTALDFSISLARPALADPRCELEIDLQAKVDIVDNAGFCLRSCAPVSDCGLVFEDCARACADTLANVRFGDDPVCNAATEGWLGCLHAEACNHDSPEQFCMASRPDLDQLLTSNECPRPVPPPPRSPPPPDPSACNPEEDDLVAGNVGDFYVLARAADLPNTYYAVIDLTQLAEVDAVLAANPDDPLLSTARSVVPALTGLDGSTRDLCSTNGIVALRYEGTISPQFIALANSELSDIQDSLNELTELAAELKKQLVAFIFDSIFCPAVRSIYGFFFDIKPGGGAGVVLTEVAVAAHGCF